jgi:hypothetical protein
MPPFPELKTARLRLNELTIEDAPALLAIHGNAWVYRNGTWQIVAAQDASVKDKQ